MTALHFAAERGHVESIKALIAAGADKEATCSSVRSLVLSSRATFQRYCASVAAVLVGDLVDSFICRVLLAQDGAHLTYAFHVHAKAMSVLNRAMADIAELAGHSKKIARIARLMKLFDESVRSKHATCDPLLHAGSRALMAKCCDWMSSIFFSCDINVSRHSISSHGAL